VKMGAIFASLDKDDDVLNVGINRAVDALAKKLDSIRSLGAHPQGGEPVVVRKGRFGPYIQHGNTVANLPREVTMEEIGLGEAVALLQTKGKTLKPKAGARKAAKAKPAAKPAAASATPKPKPKPKNAKKPAPKRAAKAKAG